MFPNLVNILKVDLKFLLFVRYLNVLCGEVTYKVVNCSYDIHDGDNDGEEDVDDDGGKCGEVTYEVVEGSDSQKPGGIISRRETGGGSLMMMFSTGYISIPVDICEICR